MLTPTLARMQKARTTLLLDNPFFGMLAYHLEMREDATCKTAWTDGKTIAFSPAFAATLTNEEMTAVFAHEVMHNACGHPWRRDGRDQKRYNIAADYAINPILKNAGFKLPNDVLLDAQYEGKHSEWIYDRLPAPQDGDNGGTGDDGNGPGTPSEGVPGDADGDGIGEVRDAPGDADAPSEADWKERAAQAAKLASGRGSLPGNLKREIDAALATANDWIADLVRYAQEISKADYAFQRPNVRYIAHGLYLPSLHSTSMGRIVVAVDTSGSIDNVLVGKFAKVIDQIHQTLQPSQTDVMYCDTRVHRVDTFYRDDAVTIDADGGGGTAFEPVFDRVDEGEQPAVLIYLTDMDGSFPDAAPSYPVVWANYGRPDHPAPFGDVIPCA